MPPINSGLEWSQKVELIDYLLEQRERAKRVPVSKADCIQIMIQRS
jgi:hypothetical protein